MSELTRRGPSTTGGAPTNRSIRIIVEEGAVQNVENLPEGWDYEIVNWDENQPCVECCEQPIPNGDVMRGLPLCFECMVGQLHPSMREEAAATCTDWELYPYKWMLREDGPRLSGVFWIAIVSRAYEDSGLLVSDFEAHMDAIKEGFVVWFSRH